MKKIGIVVAKGADNRIILSEAYARFALAFGDLTMVMATNQNVADVDLLIVPGGADVDPARYSKEPPHWTQQNANVQMEWFDTIMLPQYINAGIPVFAICRGFQSINVLFGGTLTQDFAFPYSVKERDQLVEQVSYNAVGIKETNWWFKPLLPELKPFKVNSLHHQGIFQQQLSAELFPVLYSTETKGVNNVEAYIHKTAKVVAVQYHPEEIYDTFSIQLINAMLYGGI